MLKTQYIFCLKYIFLHNANNNESNHISALVEPAIEVGEVEGEEGNDVGEGGALENFILTC